MSELADQITTRLQEDDDLDVHGHGLKELAVGLGAATVVAGGAVAAGPAVGALLSSTVGVHSAAAGAASDAETPASQASAPTVGRPEVLPAAGRGVTATGAKALAGQVTSDPLGTTDRLVLHAVRVTRETRDAGVTAVERAAGTAQQATSEKLEPHARADVDDDGSTTAEAGAAGTTVTVRTG